MTTRPLVYLDTETTGLDPARHEVWEIAWAVGECPIVSSVVWHAPPVVSPEVREALRANGYLDRCRAISKADSDHWEDYLIEVLDGATLVGANPAFDAAMLRARWGRAPWHYRLLDIEAYAMGVLGWDEMRGLAAIAEHLGVDAPNHTAAGGVAHAQGVPPPAAGPLHRGRSRQVTATAELSTLTVLPELVQRTPEWYEQRRGMLTASMVGALIAVRQVGPSGYDCPACDAVAGDPCLSARAPHGPIKTMHSARIAVAASRAETVIEPAAGKVVDAIARTLAAERLTDHTDTDNYTSADMWRGLMSEPYARDLYATATGRPVAEVGFMVRTLPSGTRLGYSPDGLTGGDGLIEIKAPRAKSCLDTILTGRVPAEHMAQIQTGLLVSGLAWCDYLPYAGGLIMRPIRVTPSPAWFAAITAAVEQVEAQVVALMAAYRFIADTDIYPIAPHVDVVDDAIEDSE